MTEDQDLVRPFRLALLGVAIGFVFLGGLLAAFGSGADRPEGVAERWLANVGDTRRDGVKDRARHDAAEVGPVELAKKILPEGSTDGRAAFIDMEVGKAAREGDVARVPYRLHQRIDGDAGPPVEGTVLLRKLDDKWRVVHLDPPREGVTVPSEGGTPAAEAPFGLFVGAIAVAAVVVTGCSLVVKAAERSQVRAGITVPSR